MAAKTRAALDILPHWADLNDHLIELVDLIPEDKLDWSPSAEEWSFRAEYVHVVGGRHYWLGQLDGAAVPDYKAQCATPAGIKAALSESWERMERAFSDPDKLATEYEPLPGIFTYRDPPKQDGNYLAYHRLVHDVLHRANVMRLLERLGAELPADRRRRPL